MKIVKVAKSKFIANIKLIPITINTSAFSCQGFNPSIRSYFVNDLSIKIVD